MKQSEIAELSTPEVVERLENEQANLNRLNMSHVVSPLDNPMQIRYVRRTIARLKTELLARNSQEQVATKEEEKEATE